MQPLVRAADAPAVARADAATVEHVLHAQLYVGPDRLAGDLDAVLEGRDRSMRPARPAVLWDVLIEGGGQEVQAVLVAPGEIGGIVVAAEVWQRVVRVGAADGGIAADDDAHLNLHVLRQQLRAAERLLHDADAESESGREEHHEFVVIERGDLSTGGWSWRWRVTLKGRWSHPLLPST